RLQGRGRAQDRAPAALDRRARDQARAEEHRARSEGRCEGVRQAAGPRAEGPRAEEVKAGLAALLVCAAAGAARADAAAPLGPREAEPPEIELLTFGVGDRLFERWGHGAICLRYHDPRN